MKKLKKFLLGLLVCTIMLSQSLSSFAWESSEGESGKVYDFYGEYRIRNKYQAWLIYWVDDTQHVCSKVALVGKNGAINEFMTADYKCIYTRWENRSTDGKIPIEDMRGMPLPFNDDETSNAKVMKAWMANSRDFLIQVLNAPEDIKTCEIEDKYFFIAEPVYMFSLYSPVKGVAREQIVGTTYQYANYIRNSLLGTSKYPSGTDKKDGLSEYGWYGTCRYTNGFYGTCECVGNDNLSHMTKLGITRAGTDFYNKNTDTDPYPFSYFADRSNGLGIVIKSNSEKDGDPDNPPDNPDGIEETHPYVGNANPDTYTYHYSSEYNLNKRNNPQGRIPSGEILQNGIDVDTWFCNYTLTKHSSFRSNI